MIRRLPLLLLLAFFFLPGCEKEEPEDLKKETEAQEIEMEIDLNLGIPFETYAECYAKFKTVGPFDYKPKEYGVVIIDVAANVASNVVKFEMQKINLDTAFTLENLKPSSIYQVFAYVKNQEKEWRSDTLEWPTKEPIVENLSAYFGNTGDTVMVKGRGFSNNPDHIQVTFGDVAAKVIKVEKVNNESIVSIIVPELDFEPKTVNVSSGNYTFTFEELFTRRIWKNYQFPGYGFSPIFLFSFGNKAYFNIQIPGNNQTMFEFDTETKVFTKKADLPVFPNYSCATSMNGKGYMVFITYTDRESVNKLYEYNPETDQWLVREELISPLRSLFYSVFTDGNLLYFFGGYDFNSKEIFNDYFTYDVENDLYGELPSLNFRLTRYLYEHEGEIYSLIEDSEENYKIVKFNRLQQEWTEVFSVLDGFERGSSFLIGEKFYFYLHDQQKIWSYNLIIKEWKEEGAQWVLPEPLTGFKTSWSLNGKAYMAGEGNLLWEFAVE